MPLYEYVCDQDGTVVELMRSMSKADDPVEDPAGKERTFRRKQSTFAAGGTSVSVGGGMFMHLGPVGVGRRGRGAVAGCELRIRGAPLAKRREAGSLPVGSWAARAACLFKVWGRKECVGFESVCCGGIAAHRCRVPRPIDHRP